MESWIWLPIISALIWSSVNLVDANIRRKYIKNSIVVSAVTGLVSLLVLVLIPFKGLHYPGLWILVAALSSGIIYVYVLPLYFKALSVEDTPTVIALWYITPILIPIMAKFVLNESLTFVQYIGFFLIIISGVLISLKDNPLKKICVSKAAVYIFIAGIIINFTYIFEKYVYSNDSFWNGFILIQLGTVLGGISMLLIWRKKIRKFFQKSSIKPISLLSLGETGNIIAQGLVGAALVVAPVTLVVGFTNLQPLFAFILVLLVSKYFPRSYKEEFKPSRIVSLGFAIILLIIGMYFIAA
ncbi:MAG: EamA family transporter [Nanoarchaeota archaeon]|nr:EamA family transporter [Nanoarchaeota archaeon]